MNILIIEDEGKAAARLAELLCLIDDSINIVGIIDSIENGVDWFNQNPIPELMFSDIELADGVSFELFKQIKLSCPIIFCTAYNQYMVEAFDTNAVSYLLKPITREAVERALEKYHAMQEVFSRSPGGAVVSPNSIEELLKLFGGAAKRYKSTFIVNQGERIIPISVEDIAYIYATSGGMQITTVKNQNYSYSSTLDEVGELLDTNIFFRVNRQFIISRRSIHSVSRYFNRKLSVKLIQPTPEQILISRLKTKLFLLWMER